MRPTDAHPELLPMLRTLKLVVGAILVGLAAFLGYAAWSHLGPAPRDRPAEASFFSYVAVALGATQPIVFALTRMALVRQAAQAYDKADTGPFRGKYMAAVIVGAAGTEAAGLLAGVAYLLEGRVAALGAGGWCVLALLAALPSRRGVDHAIDSRP